MKELKFVQLAERLAKLNRIGIALTSMSRLDELLELIVKEARGFTSADAGSLYLRDGDKLRFVVSQNDTLSVRLGDEGERALFFPHLLTIRPDSIAGYVAYTKENLNIPNAYQISPDASFGFNSDFDRRNDYRTQSVLAVPMLDRFEQVQGVLELINAYHDGAIVPFDPQFEDLMRSLASQAAVAVNNVKLTSEIKQAHLNTIYRLSVAAEYRDEDTSKHLRRMSHYAAALASRLGFDKSNVELILYASPMHDVGKIGVPDAILLKPGSLSPEERKIMEEHTIIGARILKGSDSPLLRLSEVVALTHHEKWDGTGYPYGLIGDKIPLVGRIVAVADVFDALTSSRVYKDAIMIEKAFAMLQNDAGSHFDPACVKAFSAIRNEVHSIYERYKD